VASASAANSNAMTISASSFEETTNGTPCISRLNNGISNLCSVDTNFIYGIPKGPSTAGYTITFAGNNTSTSDSTTCTVFSNAANGSFLAYSTSIASGVSGNWTRSITFNATQAPVSGRLTAYAGVPANQQGVLYGLTLAY
jgi:hypothetical protein